jgi:alginate export protein
LIVRIGIAVGTLVALGVPALVFAQDTPPLQRSPLDPGADSRFSIFDSGPRPPENPGSRIGNQPVPEITLSGSLRLEYLFRDSAIEGLRARLNGAAPPGGDDSFITGESRLRLDLNLAERGRLAMELANLPYDGGQDLPLAGGGAPDILLRQLYADIEGVFHDDLTLRVGAFDYAWRIRPHDEPFLLDLGRSEPFFASSSARFTRATADREIALPGGALLKWHAGDFVEVEALWMTVLEGGPASRDEALGALLANFPLSERSAVFLGALHVAGPGDGRVTTAGGGIDAYFGPDRELELFGEAWFQSGRLTSGVSKRAWAGRAGARVVAGDWSTEVSADYVSGDRDPADGRDEGFQSYEGRERFRIVESAEFGLDWDTNLSSMRLSGVRQLGSGISLRLDVGRFRLPEPAVDGAGAPLGIGKDLGTEADLTLSAGISKAVEVWATAAALFGSKALEAASPDGDRAAILAALGISVKW